MWDPEEGRRLHGGIGRGFYLRDFHLFESGEGRRLLAVVGEGPRNDDPLVPPERAFMEVWDLGEVPAATGHLRPATHLG
jgi:hypothetical protein